MKKTNLNPEITIQKTLMTARLFDGFWDRWIAHGIERDVIEQGRDSFLQISDWTSLFQEQALIKEKEALLLEADMNYKEAEQSYRLAGLYYNIVQWIYPDRCSKKIHYYEQSIELFKKADYISDIYTKYVTLVVNEQTCVGRVRIPTYYKGCMIIINPIDSSKEELFTYENHFLESGFVTISFDGPGQGETFILHNAKASNSYWEEFLEEVINYAHSQFENLNLSLFGTSSGAAWAIKGSMHPFVSKSIAVSPPVIDSTSLPDYFKERLKYVTEESTNILPIIEDYSECKSVILFHGNQDVMVKDDDMYELFVRLPEPKHLVEFADEGHCCNNKLYEVRNIGMQWFYVKENASYVI